MIVCQNWCAYAHNHMRLPMYLYTIIVEYLCVLKFVRDNWKKYFNIQDKSSKYTIQTNYCKRLLGENKNVDD